MDLKVGDKVRVIPLFNAQMELNKHFGFIFHMRSLCGKTVTISKINGRIIRIKEMEYNWHESWFEPVNNSFILNDLMEVLIENN